MDAMKDAIEIRGLVDIYGNPLPMPMDIGRSGADDADGYPICDSAWDDWYEQVVARRIQVEMHTERMANKETARAAHLALCRQPDGQGFLYWLVTFVDMLEPRNESDRTIVPFIPFPRQAELALTIAEVMAIPREGALSSLLVEKARAVGATWIDAAYNVWCWLFEPMFTGLVISRTEEQVDSKGDPSSYFWKMRFILKNLPEWMLPRNFEIDGKYDNFRKLTNPQSEAVVTGATTTEDAGRAGRYKRVTIDEGAFIDGFGPIWNNLANVTYHRFTYSSANTRNGMDFYNLRFGREGYTRPRVFTYHWNEVPGRDETWRRNMQESMSEQEFQREVMLNYLAGSGDWVYPMAQSIEPGHFPFVPGWPTRVIIDDGYDDDFAITWIQKDVSKRRIRVVGAYANSHKPLRFYGHLLLGQPSSEFRWTQDDLRLMDWIRDYGVFNAVYYGDRHGDNTDLSSGKSPFQVLAEEFGIVVITTGDPESNSLKTRRDAAAELLPRLDIDEHHGAPLVLEALRYARFPRRRDGSQPTAEFKGPIHDSTSHFRSCFEYFAINDRQEFGASGFGTGGPLPRATLSGFHGPGSTRQHGRYAGKSSESGAVSALELVG